MQPGPELDALVAEKVMGLDLLPGKMKITERLRDQDGFCVIREGERYINGGSDAPMCECFKPIPKYSTSIQAAWEVVEKMIGDGFRDFSLEFFDCGNEPIIKMWSVDWNYLLNIRATTAPHAICLAALKLAGFPHLPNHKPR